MIPIYYVVNQNELYHHGIKGQRWGIRRFQNKDGTRTDAGKKREKAERKGAIKEGMKNAAAVLGAGAAVAGAVAGAKKANVGIKRYRNDDGSLTDLGKKRYERDIRENLGKKKENRIDTSRPDPDRWVKEDLNRTKNLVDRSSDVVKQIQNVERNTAPKPTKQKLDLSKMSDQELRARINRATLERQYNDMFAPEMKPKVSKGREITKSILDTSGTVLAIGSSALGIALAIKELRTKPQ